MKIFFLDVYEKPHDEKTRVEGFWELAAREFGASLARFPLFTSDMDNVAYCKRVIEALEESEAVVGLTNKELITTFGDGYGFFSKLIEKIKEGTPFLLQSIRDWERYFSPRGGGQLEHYQYVRELYKHIEVFPTPTKVFSTDRHKDDWSDSSVWFRAGDSCFLNSELLGGREEALLSQANLLEYGRGCFPLIETGLLHYFVGPGDFLEQRPVGEKNVVAVERHFQKQNGLVFSGDFAQDRRRLSGGWQSGFDENEEMVRSVLKYIAKRADTAENRSQEAYRVFSDLERQLSLLVHKALNAYSNRLALLSYIEQDVIDELPLRDGVPDTSYLTYLNLVNLLLKNWARFLPLFHPQSKTLVKKSLQGVNYGIRRYVAHPHRAEFEGYAFRKEDIQKLKVARKMVVEALSKCRDY
ncbi:hypothetical protein [Shimia sp. SDUM112013]|uniref:hypothetical protein n=1 Tax=Shimia sp. SDUM112013 TaxID=3136160 RepID=UPI0032EC7074